MTSNISRRRFLAGSGVTAAGALLAGAPAIARAASNSKPSAAATVIKNGRVWTGTGSIAQAVAIGDDGRIMAVGSNRAMSDLVGRKTVVVSASGRTVIAGIHDGHMHPRAVVNFLIYPTLDNALLTLAELQATLQGFLDDPNTVFPGGWLNVLDWNPVGCPIDALPANKGYLDALTTDRPIILRASDGHNSWVNSKALELAGITSATLDPPGGQIVREGGEPTGVLVDAAQSLVTDLIPSPSLDDQLPYLEQISGYMATKGITSLMDAYVTEDGLEAYAAMASEGSLLQRVQAAILVPEELFGVPAQAVEWANELRLQYSNVPGLSVPTVKIFMDGVMEYPAQTAALLDPYLDGNGSPTGNRGNLYVDNVTLNPLVTALDAAGWQVHLHAIGDHAVRTGLDAFQAARAANGPTENRHAMAHLQLIDPADLPRFAELGVIADFQLQWACDDYWTNEALWPYIGDERHGRLYPAKQVRDAGGRLAGGSDWPVDPLYPWNQVATAVDRIGLGGLPETGAGGTGLPLDDFGISLDDSLTMHTKGSAYQMHQEASTGTIEVGKVADLQILDIDVTTASTARIALANVVRTFVGGATTHDATAPSFMTTPAKAKRVEEAAAKVGRSPDGGCGCNRFA